MRCKAIQGLTADRAKIKQANFQDDGAIVELIDEGGGLFTLVYCFPDEPDAINAAPALAVPSINPDIPATPPAAPLDSPAPTPTGSAEAFVAARRIGPTTVLYTDAKGRGVLREGGSRAWRNNNPGNIRKGDFAVSAGAIGDDGSFAIFPDARTGMEVIVALLRSPSYRSLTLEDAIFRYAPPVENNSDKYIAFVEKETGISRDVVVGSLPAKMLSAVAKAIRGMEGWTEGKERPDMPLSGTALAASGAPVGVTSAAGASEEWMGIAAAEAALPARDRSAWADPEENPRILNYFKVAAPWFEPSLGDETDWCAAFVNFCLLSSGHQGTNHPGARSFFWNKDGRFVVLPGPVKGCIAVQRHAPFDDPEWKTGQGHVGFVTSFTATQVTLLGGNQGSTIRTQTFRLETPDAAGQVVSRFVTFLMPAMN